MCTQNLLFCFELQKNKKKRIQNDTSGIEAWRSCIGSPSDTELSEPNESVSKSEKYWESVNSIVEGSRLPTDIILLRMFVWTFPFNSSKTSCSCHYLSKRLTSECNDNFYDIKSTSQSLNVFSNKISKYDFFYFYIRFAYIIIIWYPLFLINWRFPKDQKICFFQYLSNELFKFNKWHQAMMTPKVFKANYF